MAAGWGGAVVVVRGRESRPHGKGRQRACSARLEGEEAAGEHRRVVRSVAAGGQRAGTRDPAQAVQVGIRRSGPRVSDLHNLVCDPATLLVAWRRVRGNRGSRSAGVDGQTAYEIEVRQGVERFLAELREELRAGMFRPLAVRERVIPKRGGKRRYLGIPTVRDRVVQAALKLVLEPIFEVDFQPCSYGFRPGRRTQDAIAEIQHFTFRSYEWVVESDIEACFDRIDHPALMDRVRADHRHARAAPDQGV